MGKRAHYGDLVGKRRAFTFPKGLLNPVEINGGAYDCDHVEPWAQWHGDLDADVLLIGQDFGGKRFFLEHHGHCDPDSHTNRNLMALFEHMGIDLGPADDPNPEASVFMVNAIVGIIDDGPTPGKCSTFDGIKDHPEWISINALEFIAPLIEIVRPRVIICMGMVALRSLAHIYPDQVPVPSLFSSSVETDPPIHVHGMHIFPVYHCSMSAVNRNREWDAQCRDWRRIGSHLQPVTDYASGRTRRSGRQQRDVRHSPELKDTLLDICTRHVLSRPRGVTLPEPYIPYIPQNWNGNLVLAEAQNHGTKSRDYLKWLLSLDPQNRMLRLCGNYADGVGCQPWDDGSLKLAVAAAFGDDPDCWAVSNAILWSRVDDRGRNDSAPCDWTQRESVTAWRDFLNVLKPEWIVTAGKKARMVIDETGYSGGRLNLQLPSPLNLSSASGMFDEKDLLDRYPEVQEAMKLHPGLIRGGYRRNKLFYACHAVSKMADAVRKER